MEWISVKERLPRHGVEVLVLWKTHKNKKQCAVAAIWKDKDYGWHFRYNDVDGANLLDDSQVTHWMPLPPPPKQ